MRQRVKISQKFRSLLALIEHDRISREELIQLALETTNFNKTQATRLIARNVHVLVKHGLIQPLGKRKERYYDFSQVRNDHVNTKIIDQTTSELVAIESRVSEEIKVLDSEIKTYNELWEKYPEKRSQIDMLLEQAKREHFALTGKERALKRLIFSQQQLLTKADK
ncbi:hypothetical protein ACWU4D_18400 [Vibrio sp. WJH972]